jgi:hypothetical protein
MKTVAGQNRALRSRRLHGAEPLDFGHIVAGCIVTLALISLAAGLLWPKL